MRLRALEPFGVEIRGVQVADVSPSRADDVLDVVCRGRVAVFRDQRADDAGFEHFLQSLGEMMFTEGETPVPDTPSLNIVTNQNRTRPPRSVFHTDTSYVARPPAFTALRAIEVPSSGGQTLFSDQITVLDALPTDVRDCLSGRTIRHAYTAPGLAEVATWHPALRRHPVTGEHALYLSTPERCASLSGEEDAHRGARMIRALYARSIRPRALYAHTWRPGDIVIWDDRSTLHRADHSNVVGARTFHRGMVRGEVPIAA